MKPWFDLPSPLPFASSISIIGGGIMGLLMALKLQNQGFQVTIFEKNSALMGEGSGNPAAILDPYISLQQTSPEQIYFTTAYQKALHFYRSLGGECFTAKALKKFAKSKAEIIRYQKIAGNYSSDFAIFQNDHILFKQSGILQPKDVGRKLSKDLTIKTNMDVRCFSYDAKKSIWQLYDSKENSIHSSNALILANSFQAHKFLQTKFLPVKPVKGQISFIYPDRAGINNSAILCKGGYVTPLIDNAEINQKCHIIGASFERDIPLNQRHHISKTADIENLKKLEDILNLDSNISPDALLGSRASMRAMSPDHLPIIGAVPDKEAYQHYYQKLYHGPDHAIFKSAPYHKSLYICAGLGARGMLSAPFAADILTWIIGRNLPKGDSDTLYNDKILHALHPARFHIRRLIRGASLK